MFVSSSEIHTKYNYNENKATSVMNEQQKISEKTLFKTSIFYAFCIVERIADNQPQKHVFKYIEMFCCKNC